MKHELAPLVEYLQLEGRVLPWRVWETYRRWLASEATVAGGIGPDEGDRLIQRHIGDSLSYASAFPEPPATLIDYGSGVGLPGIPLAILWPGTAVLLRDRSRRRVELLDRVVRILELTNVEVERGSIEEDARLHQAIVTRAVVPVPRWVHIVPPRLAVGGQAVTALGRSCRDLDLQPPDGCALRRKVLPDKVLDHSVAFLIMSRTSPGART